MSKSYRIKSTPGDSNGYLKVNVDLSQNYDHLEILSLKISQLDDYGDYCSEYGVVAGRVEINDGFGVPNTKVSIFIPVEDVDLDNPVISSLYPYQTPFPNEKNSNGLRYNLLPKNQQTLDHTPVGSFPKKREILDDSTILEIYEKYYKYTTTTNESGDYILFGIPVGEHFLHYDCDLSDVGFISSRPYEMMSQGYSNNLFEDSYTFKNSSNIDSLPQIISQNITVNVEPFWCDSLSVGRPIGINRYDISIPYQVTPTAIFMGSIFSDDEKDSLNKNCSPDKQMGKMEEVITSSGEIEAIRRNVDGGVESFKFNDGSIDDNGNWSVLLPMNIRKVVTDEFGNLIPSPDGIKGIATEGDYRFRISMDATGNDKRLRQRAKFLVPNTNNNFNFGEYSQAELKDIGDGSGEPVFTINEQLSTITDGTLYSADTTNQYNYLTEFYPFRWKKVYTVKQYIGRYQKPTRDESRGFIGMKDIYNSVGVNKYPSNRMDVNVNFLYALLCMIIGFFGHLIAIINAVIMNLNGLVTMICQVKIPVGLCITSENGSKYVLEYETEQQSCSFLGCYWVDSILGIDVTKHTSSSPLYDPAVDFIGWQSNKIPGQFDEGLGSSCDARDWYPPAQSYTSSSGNYANSSLYPPHSVGGGGGLTPLYGSDYPTNTKMPWNLFVNSNGDSKNVWVYSELSDQDGQKRYRLNSTGPWPNSIKSCSKDPLPAGCAGTSILGFCFQLKFKCLFSGIFCKKCKSSCPEGDTHSCCPSSSHEWGCDNNEAGCGDVGASSCCCDCCVKIPVIPLKCKDEGKVWSVQTIIPTFFAFDKCNQNYIIPFSCSHCGGTQTPGIKDWVNCILEPVANSLRMLKFDFYNDWVGGSLYFPLIKRKYKLKKKKKKFGLIKKDKFCDFDCVIKPEFGNGGEYQGDKTFHQWRLKVSQQNSDIVYQGCKANTKGKKRVTGWYGTSENDTSAWNLELAVKDLIFPGTVEGGDGGCNIVFDTYQEFEDLFVDENINFNVKSRKVGNIHGKPEYVEVVDGNGNTSWKNIGGHSHHRNICNNTRLVERKEYFKTSLDCTGEVNSDDLEELEDNFIGIVDEEETVVSGETFGCTTFGTLGTRCSDNNCDKICGSNGVAPCKNYDVIRDQVRAYNGPDVRHGLISWNDGEIYYTPRVLPPTTKEVWNPTTNSYTTITSSDSNFNGTEYRANLLLPTTIMELGSSVYCDIDDVPFILDQLIPTTFNISSEDINYKTKTPISYVDEDGQDGALREFKKFEDDKDSTLNLRAYATFGCQRLICSNILATVNQSQIGVEMIDKNDIGVEIGSCFVRFDHDEDLRGYFCRKFSGFKGDSTFHHSRPGSIQFDNDYQTYPEITLSDGYNLYYQTDADNGPQEIIKSEYNDGDSFIPGDACGYKNPDNSSDYFYGLAPGMTSAFINYPNGDVSGGASGTINFGLSPHPGNVDTITNGEVFITGGFDEDTNNGSSLINGIRFNRSQTPYHLYFGLVPGKTSLHKTVGKFFADKINAVTLEGVGASSAEVNENIINAPKFGGSNDNPNNVYKTCLGETIRAADGENITR